jgi:hypothetical protein
VLIWRLESSEPGRRSVCDDDVCSECIIIDEGRRLLIKRKDGWLKDGYICLAKANNAVDVERVCDDGVCFGCRKIVWEGDDDDTDDYGDDNDKDDDDNDKDDEEDDNHKEDDGNNDEVEDYLESGFNCFLVNDVPIYGLKDIKVVCDDLDCFGCIKVKEDSPRTKIKSLREYIKLGYTCTITKKTAHQGDDIVCKYGKFFFCTLNSASGEGFPVSRGFLSLAEEYLDDGHNCGLTLQSNFTAHRSAVLCTGQICLNCWRGHYDEAGRDTKVITEDIAERARDLAKDGYKCAAVFGQVKTDVGIKNIICGEEVCFTCRK